VIFFQKIIGNQKTKFFKQIIKTIIHKYIALKKNKKFTTQGNIRLLSQKIYKNLYFSDKKNGIFWQNTYLWDK
jgi:hypothetical protein